MNISQERLKKLLHYDGDTGIFVWIYKSNKKSNISIGDIAGKLPSNSDGYKYVTLDKVKYPQHRLAYFYVNGAFDFSLEIDHINRDRADNRINNLRVVTSSQNKFNTRAKGYSVCKITGKFAAEIYCNGIKYKLGRFNTEQEARDAYLSKKSELHIIPNS